MSISTPFIRRPVATSLLMSAILLIGIAAYPLLPVAPLPRVEFPTIQVTASFPGASPETMASTVAQPLERQFSQISGVSQMTSVSVAGNTQVVVQFDLERNIDAASLDIQAGINNAGGQLPKNLPNPPLFRKVNPADSPIMILAVQSDELPLIEVDDYADNILSQQISQIDGVSQVSIGGEQKRSIRVQVDPARLAAMNLTLEDVRQMLVQATVDWPKGTIDGQKRALAIYDNDQLTKAPEVDNVILAWRNGAPVRVRDIGARRRRAGKHPARRLAERQARHPALRLQAARRQRHRHGRAHQGGAPRAARRHPALDHRADHRRPHHHHPGLGA